MAHNYKDDATGAYLKFFSVRRMKDVTSPG